MSKYFSSNDKQLCLNVNRFESPFADGLKTKELKLLLEILTKERLSPREILNRGKNGRFEVRYSKGVLLITPSQKGKSGRFWQWDVILSSSSLIPSSY